MQEEEGTGGWLSGSQSPTFQNVFAGSAGGRHPTPGAGALVSGAGDTSCGDTSSVLRTCCWDEPGQLGRCCFPQTPLVAAGLTTERLASPMEGVAPALHTASSPWHTDMAAVRLDGCVAPLTSVRPLPQAAAATSQKKVKETVTQKSWEEQRDRKYSHTS